MLLSLFTSGCAVHYKHDITEEVKSNTNKLNVAVIVHQEEISGQYIYQNSAGVSAQFGLLGGLVGSVIDAGINSSRAEDAEEAVKPYREAIIDFDYSHQLSNKIKNNLTQINWVERLEYKELTVPTEFKAESLLNGEKDLLALVIEPSYSLTPHFSRVHVSARITLVTNQNKKTKKKSKVKEIFVGKVQYQSPTLALRKNGTEIDAQVLKDTLSEGSEILVQLIRMNLQDDKGDAFYKDKKNHENNKNMYYLGEINNFDVYRSVHGTVHAIPKGDVLVLEASTS